MKRYIQILLGAALLGVSFITPVSAADGDVFKANSPEGVEITFMVISEADKTCQVGDGHDMAIGQNVTGKLTLLEMANSYTVVGVGSKAFAYCSGLTQVILQPSMTSIGDDAFYYCTAMTSVVMPQSVGFMGERAFAYCMSLVDIDIPAALTTIPESAFMGCEHLGYISIPNTVENIKTSAFEYCTDVHSVTIPSSVASIGERAFYGCFGLASVISEIYDPFPISDNVFGIDEGFTTATLFVPKGTKQAYAETDGWKLFTNIEESASENEVFYAYTDEGVKMTFMVIDPMDKTCQVGTGSEPAIATGVEGRITIPAMANDYYVTCIADSAFYNCDSLLCIFIPEGVWNIEGIHTFEGCTSLAAIHSYAEAPLTQEILAPLTNPNLLLYVNERGLAPQNFTNVIVDGQAELITLHDAPSGNNFYCPEPFMANTIRYTHNYSMTTGYNICQGWETIALPFDATAITNNFGATIVPYALWESDDSKRPFWIYELTEEGWMPSPDIHANTPYIISMPNNEMYDAEYNLGSKKEGAGDIIFMGKDAEIYPSGQVNVSIRGNQQFVPNFLVKAASEAILPLNVDNLMCENTATDYREGSRFVRNLRAVHPFEAYLMVEGSGTRTVPIFDDEETTGIMVINREMMANNREADDAYYNLNGQKVSAPRKGIYIKNGRKVLVNDKR